ncbi:cysteine--tRNA ligase [Clostridia bacterium]|nr:cysteine--tRNA ligase [Clostridia bacterium]
MKLYNTISGEKEEFVPVSGEKVNMYVCGPTVYNLVHVGNARAAVFFDMVRRYLTFKGYAVKYVQNFTDIDDKIITAANELGVSAAELSEKYVNEALADFKALNIIEADVHPRVTREIPAIIGMVKALVDNGSAYVTEDGSVYFSAASKTDYGKLSHRDVSELREGARVTADEKKRGANDFILWKPAKKGEPFWESPWGNGRPGWHIECSAMAKRYLADTIDIHAGGSDLIFPHHENEIAQSEAANGVLFSKYWLHNAMICVDGVKMSKSLGNFVLLRDAANEFSYPVVRMFILSGHYRSTLDFGHGNLEASKNAFLRIRNCYDTLKFKALDGALTEAEKEVAEKADSFRADFLAAMEDDFNTANALTAIFELVKYINVANPSPALSANFLKKLTFLTDILGIDLSEQKSAGVDTALIEKLIAERAEAKSAKDFAKSDEIRKKLTDMGVTIRDSLEGTSWTITM